MIGTASGCSDDDATPDNSGDDGGPGGGQSGEGGGGSGGSGGSGGGASGTGGSSTGGSGTGGAGGNDGGTDDGGTGSRCGDVTCDPVATCDQSGDEPTCECPDGYDDVSGFGTRCEEEDQPACDEDDDCDGDGHCIDGVCCESACDDPPACHTDEGATCEDGENCEYPELDDGAACDDDDICTDDDECNDGECEGVQAECDDDNICTADSCDSDADDVDDRCVYDGTGITLPNCADDTLCAQDFACAGNARGDCNPDPLTVVDCAGEDDQCNVGQCDLATGGCVAVPVLDGTVCNDSNACTTGEACHEGACGMGAVETCDDGNSCTDDACDPVAGCSNPPNTDTCNDGNPCTENDECSGGECGGDPKDCTGVENQCNDSTCNSSGTCVPVPKDNGTACNDGLACTSNDACSGGTCTDPNTDSACGAGSISCSGNPTRTCVCDTPDYTFNMTTRVCQPNVCDPNPCTDPNATCGESGGNAICVCDPGYVDTNPSTNPVTGVTCSNVDDCAGNPCGAGRGTCIDGIDSYSCSCDMPYTAVDAGDGAECVCDLDGTFGVRITTNLAWPDVIDEDGETVLITGGTATTYSWAMRNQQYGADGKLEWTTISCGATTPDLCGTGNNGLIGAEAYAQFLTTQIWGTSQAPGSMPVERFSRSCPPADLGKTCFDALDVPTPLAGSAFQTPETAVLFGIHLTDPMGAWPSADQNIGTVMTPGTNGSYWRDDDGDGDRGVTSYAARPGGTPIDGNIPDPPIAFPATSPTCSTPYAYWPVGWLGGLFSSPCDEQTLGLLCRVKEFHIASRSISALKGAFTDCNTITGDVIGPNPDSPTDPGTDGEMRINARVGGCVHRTGGVGSSSEAGCAEVIWDWVDDQAPACPTGSCPVGSTCVAGHCEAQRITDASFVIKRAPSTATADGVVTCAEIRAMTF